MPWLRRSPHGAQRDAGIPSRISLHSIRATCLLLLLFGSEPTRAADDLAVDLVNASVPTLCAEKDNVTLNLVSPTVRRFAVEATHPAYIGTITNDRAAP